MRYTSNGLLKMSKVEPQKNARTYVYFIRAGDDGPVKIGIAFDPYQRLDELQTANPFPLRIIGAFEGGRAEELRLHALFAADRLEREWFKPTQAILDMVAQHKPPTRAEVAARPANVWRGLAMFETLLNEVLRAARTECNRQNPIMCRQDLWLKKYRLMLQKNGPRSIEFFNVAHDQIMAALPPCRPNCRCEDAEKARG